MYHPAPLGFCLIVLRQRSSEVRSGVEEIAKSFNERVHNFYHLFFEEIRRRRLSSVIADRTFLTATGSYFAIAGGALLYFGVAEPGTLASSLGVAIPSGYLTARLLLGRPPGRELVTLEVPSLQGVVSNLRAPTELAKQDLVHRGGLLILLDVLNIGPEWLGLAGWGLAALASLFGKSLERMKQETIAELGTRVRSKLDVDKEVRAVLDLYEKELIANARNTYAANRAKALRFLEDHSRIFRRPAA
jgi:hypothetical protein